MKLTMTYGLPASGKSTWAREQVTKSNGQIKRVNKDDLRAMIDAGVWNKSNEKEILSIRDTIIYHYLSHGFSVIVDDTNLAPKHEVNLREIAKEFEAEFEAKSFLDVPLSECIRRDLARPESVGKKVIRRMYEQVKYSYVAQYEISENLPWAIICDIDGTIAHMNGRSPYDYSKVSTDVVDPIVRDVLYKYTQRDIMEETPPNYVVIVSGREDGCKQETLDWLKDNQIPFDELHMRKADDKRDDRIVKKEIFDEWIKNRYNVRFVLDDRDRVVEMWRSLGLKVLQVGEGDF